MAIHVFEDAYISIANVSLSATKVTVDDGYNKIAAVRMGHTADNNIKGRKKQQIAAVFLQDYSSNNVHATLKAALDADTVAVVVRPSSDPASNTNPEYSGTMRLFEYKPIDGAAGDKQDVSVVFETAGTALTYSEGA
jgi:hypothetical protein